MKAIQSVVVFTFLLVSLSVCHTATAVTTYYVNIVSGLDTNNGLTAATAVKTINPKAAALSGPGDTINLCGTGPYLDTSVTGRNIYFDSAGWTGASTNVITIQSDPGGSTKAVIDPGYSDFVTNPNSAWVLCTDTGAHADEYISVNAYVVTPQDGARGSFLQANDQAGDRLLTYARVEDLRATNESFALVPYDGDNTHGRPAWGNTTKMYRWAYRGPGMWLDPATNKIHIRLSSTHISQPGVTDYVSTPSSTVGTDPRNLSLSISLKTHFAFNCQANYMTFKNLVIQNGGDQTAYVKTDHVTFDHCTFNMSRNGLNPNPTKFLLFQHCIFNGNLPSYVCRSDVKDDFSFVDYDGVSMKNDGLCRETQVTLIMGGSNEDMEVANCEFRNGHDGILLMGTRPRFHHNLLENLNDEAIMFYGSNTAVDVRAYNNVIRKTLQAFSSSQGSWTSTGARYFYRNVIDKRLGVFGERSLPPDPISPLFWYRGEDFKFNPPVPEFYAYQNTFVMGNDSSAECSAVWSNISQTTQWTRRFMNNIFMSISNDETFHIIPNNAAYPNLSNGNDWCRRITNAVTPELKWYNAALPATTTNSYQTLAIWLASTEQANYVATNGVGWETNSLTSYPQFANVQDYIPTDSGTYVNADYRLKSGSPNIGTGVNLQSLTWGGLTPPPDSATADTTPDIGALPYGAAVVAVGVDSLKVFPDTVTPIAEAGDYSIIADTDQTGFETVSFDSAGSSDPDGSISSYNWVYNGASISTSSTFSKDLPIGTHQVFLTVTDNSSKTATDMREITITDPSTNDNIVKNPGYESGSTNWVLGSGCSIVSTTTHYGSGALKLTGGATYVSTEQSIPVIANAATKVSCWIKTDTITGGQTKLQVLWYDSGGTGVGSATDLGLVSGTTGWTYYSATPTAPSTAVTATIKLLQDGGTTGGYSYYDDIRFMITDNLVKNGFMERTNWVATTNTQGGWYRLHGLPAMLTDETLSHSGAGSLQMIGITDYYIVEQLIPVTDGATYKFEGWIKTASMGTKKAWVEVRWCDSLGAQISYPWAASVTGTSAYTKVSPTGGTITATHVAEKTITQMKITLKIDSAATSGTAYFDDFYVK